MPYSNCLPCKQQGKIVRLDTPTQGHHKYCRKCRIDRASDKMIRQIREYNSLSLFLVAGKSLRNLITTSLTLSNSLIVLSSSLGFD